MWLKLSDDFGDDAARAGLSDASVRTHIEALLWIMRREGEPVLDRRDLRRALESSQAEEAVAQLLATGWWQRLDDGRFRVLQSMNDQLEPEVIVRRREAAAERQRRKRLKAVGLDPDTGEDVSRRDVTRDSLRDATRDPGRAGTGRGGSGEALRAAGSGARDTADLRLSLVSADGADNWPPLRPIPDGHPPLAATPRPAGYVSVQGQLATSRECRVCGDPLDHAVPEDTHPACEP
ncbi:hypothetical protein [Blastococcus mobilis]|uniref:Uncharacterized protein n=1 Tax=Blastococcus mobilis TaxID=1938746 RepID=A0A238VND0_9ACTN|nr:hypothetical protein [Blastococcus mobilis]SNR35736.1 hypothetical protein SAMN06272737_10410 [Blastococcus mobilis]